MTDPGAPPPRELGAHAVVLARIADRLGPDVQVDARGAADRESVARVAAALGLEVVADEDAGGAAHVIRVLAGRLVVGRVDPDSPARTIVVPGGLVVEVGADVEASAADLWSELEEADSDALLQDISTALRGLAARLGEAEAAAERAEFRVRTQVRAIERQERRLLELRGRAQDASVLQQRYERLKEQHDRVMARRSVRAALRSAQTFRPVFRFVRGQTSTGRRRSKGRRPVRTSAPPVTPRAVPRRPGKLGEVPEASRFHDLLAPLLEASDTSGDFRRLWTRSEAALPSQLAGELEDAGRVAIVMPTYQRAHVIADALQSVLEQTYADWELHVCDDGSTDDTASVIAAIGDPRIVHHRLDHAGAAAARNHGLRVSDTPYVAYLDSDNVWHPCFLERMVGALNDNPGRLAAYATYVDVILDGGGMRLKKARDLPFDYERLAEKNFIDLNTYVHRRGLVAAYGGFDETLSRQQDWDLVLRQTFHHEPLYVDNLLLLYRRNRDWGQITIERQEDTRPTDVIRAAVADYYESGLQDAAPLESRVTVLSWDVSRNHFSKAYNIAESVEDPDLVQLLGFQFFEDPIFGPYESATPDFHLEILAGAPFPQWSSELARAVAHTSGDLLYAVKPRLPSLGVALLANALTGTPVVLEMNDLETVVQRPRRGELEGAVDLADVDARDPDLLDPHGALWTSMMETLAMRVPHRATHNDNLDRHFGGGAFRMRNAKDDAWFDPSRYDRDAVREELGFTPDDRVLLFGGMVRRHKGVFDLAEVIERAGPQYKLLVVGSRETPDQRRLREGISDRVRVIEHVDRNRMAAVNLAADAVVLRLDPEVPASHYQMPYKLTDAMAMRVPVLANDISDMGELGRRGYLRLVPYGDDAALVDALHELEDDPEGTQRMVDSARRLYLREFSYRATRVTLARMAEQVAPRRGVLPVARDFADFFARFRLATAQAADL